MRVNGRFLFPHFDPITHPHKAHNLLVHCNNIRPTAQITQCSPHHSNIFILGAGKMGPLWGLTVKCVLFNDTWLVTSYSAGDEWIRNSTGGMILPEDNRTTRRKTRTSATSSTTNPTCTALGVGRDSSVDIATRYGLDGPGIESWWGRDFPHQSRPALGPTQPPVQCVPGVAAGVWRWPRILI
jgi:hypothetical protein